MYLIFIIFSDVLKEQTECYIRALQWTLSYYYRGVQSWSWYYPHHYAPYISDVQNFKDLNIDFELGTPFLPFEQLLSVLPAQSKTFLPQPFQTLMTDENSELIEFYPPDFDTDLNGKKQDWEAVVLIPFIDENKLLKAMAPLYDQLTQEEKQRNVHGPMILYEFNEKSTESAKAPFGFPDIAKTYCDVKPFTLKDVSSVQFS